MQKTSGLAKSLIVVGLSATVLFFSCDSKKTDSTKDSKKATEAPATTPSGKIAYVNLDTLGEKYEYFKTKKAEFEKKTASMEGEVERLAKNLQNEYAAFQKKAQAGTLTQAEGEAGQKRLGQMQQNIEEQRQKLGAQLMKEQDAFNAELQQRLDDYLIKYNADKGYDLILSYVKGGNILFANKALDITDDVIKGMNSEDGSKPAAKADTAK